jgi:type I restriction-modification system DNA methylase subunit
MARNRPGTLGDGAGSRALIEADLVDCMVALPGQLFYSTPIPVCLWSERGCETTNPAAAIS